MRQACPELYLSRPKKHSNITRSKGNTVETIRDVPRDLRRSSEFPSAIIDHGCLEFSPPSPSRRYCSYGAYRPLIHAYYPCPLLHNLAAGRVYSSTTGQKVSNVCVYGLRWRVWLPRFAGGDQYLESLRSCLVGCKEEVRGSGLGREDQCCIGTNIQPNCLVAVWGCALLTVVPEKGPSEHNLLPP